MSGIGAFLNSFASTTLELQKRKQEQMQFQAQLQMQQNQMQMQQQQFQQQLQFRESQRQDELAQNKVENQRKRFDSLREAANTQSQMATRQDALAEKAKEHQASIDQKNTALRNDPKILGLQQKIAMQKRFGVNTSTLEQQLQQRYQELGGDPNATVPGSAGPLPGGNAQGGPQDVPGGGGAAPGDQGQLPPAESPQGQPQQPQQAQQPQMGQPMQQPQAAQAGGMAPASESTSPLEEFPASNPQEEERLNKIFKENDIPRVAVSPQTKAKTAREAAENKFKTAVAEAQVAGMPEQKGTIEDIFRQHGLSVDVEAHQKGTQIKSRRVGGHFGGTVLGSGMSFGGTTSESEQKLPTIDLFPKKPGTGYNSAYGAINTFVTGEDAREDKTLDTSVAMTNALFDAANKGVKVSQPYVGAMKDVLRDRVDDHLGTYKGKPAIEAGSFDSVLEPKRYQAASAAIVLTHADQQLKGITEKNGLDYDSLGVPQVVDAKTSPAEVLGNFGKVLDRIGTKYPNMSPNKAEGQVVSELTTRLQGKPLTAEERVQAEQALNRVQKSPEYSDRFKAQVERTLGTVLSQPERPQQPGKPTSQSGGGGVPGIRGATTLAALGGLSQFGADKAQKEQGQKPAEQPIATPAKTPVATEAPKSAVEAPKPVAQPVAKTDALKGAATQQAKKITQAKPLPQKSQSDKPAQQVNAALGSIGASKNREETAKSAASSIKNNYARLSPDEKKAIRTSWNTARTKWKSLGVSDETIAQVEKIINPKE